MEIFNFQKNKASKKNKKKYEEEKQRNLKSADMTTEEQEIVSKIEYYQTVAKEPINSLQLYDYWEDNQKMYSGKHWDVSFIARTRNEKKHRANMVKNHIRSTINNMRDTIVLTIPETKVDSLEEEFPIDQKEQEQFLQQQMQMPMITPVSESMTKSVLAERLTCMLKHNDNIDKFFPKYRRNILFFLMHGPIIDEIIWDNDFEGGSGPETWKGDIRTNFIDKEDFFPDPSIIDLENNLQDCGFINIQYWKKLSYIENRWDRGKFVTHDYHEDDKKDAGSEPSNAYVIKSRHRGKPYYMPDKRKQELIDLANIYKNEGDYYRYKKYIAMSKMEIDGIHCCYTAGSILLEYKPYEYEHGLYPLVFRTRFIDEDNQRGCGEIEDLKMPQMAINKAEESMLSALAKQGLGNIFTNIGAMDTTQKRNYIIRNGLGNSVHEVNDIQGIREQSITQIPPVFMQYSQSQEFFMEKSSSVTAIQKGISPGANVPLGTVQELGNRTDLKTKSISRILEEFLKERDILRIKLMSQFYTEDRYYRLKGDGNKIKTGKLNRKDMMFTWDRKDEDGKIYKEWFVPEFDLKVRVVSEIPHDRDYHINTALAFMDRGLITKEHVWETHEEGKLPSKDVAIKSMKEQDKAMAEGKQMELKHEIEMEKMKIDNQYQIKQLEIQAKQQELGVKQQEADRKDVEVAYNQGNEEKKLSLEQQKLLGELSKEDDPNKLLQFLKQSFPSIYNMISDERVPEQARKEIIQKIINTPENKLEELLVSMDNIIQQIINKSSLE